MKPGMILYREELTMGNMTYDEFLNTKELRTIQAGFDVPEDWLSDMLFPFQRDIVRWALKKGKSAILTGCGTGKSFMLLMWAWCVHRKTGQDVLIISPLSVVNQTAREAVKFNICDVHICRSQSDVMAGVNITNYEMIEHFDTDHFVGVVLDESSILKSFTSKTTGDFTQRFMRTPYKLLCTATIAPNDFTEIGTSCEFLGIMSRTEMLATYFVHDGGKTSDWRLKKAGVNKFWEWFATWAIYFNSPADLGYQTDGYDLPELNMHTVITESKIEENELFVKVAETLQERRDARKESMGDRTDTAVSLINSDDSQWLIWVDYNDESDVLRRKIDGCTEIKGSDDPEKKAQASIDFADGKIRCLVSKPSIFGFGSNFQGCHNEIFCGLSDSYERFYQAVRRCWRFGQTQPVNVYIIISEKEIRILDNIKRKQKQMDEMQKRMTALMRDVTLSEIKKTTRITTTYKPKKQMIIPNFIRSAT